MDVTRRAILTAGAWTAGISALHLSMNVDWAVAANRFLSKEKRKITVAYVPVTCHLTCPVTDFISKYSLDGTIFIPRLFQGFPEVKEALLADRVQAAFMVAPMAIALREQGVGVKIVYLGHRYGSSVVVHRDGGIRRVADLRGKLVAIPSRFSDERLIVLKALRAHGIPWDAVRTVEMAPPDMPGALAVRAIDAFSVAEPFPSQCELEGFGRILFFAKEYWPDYMSCVVVARQELIDERPAALQVLVDGIARSGLWLDEGVPHRESAADFVARYYYRQSPRILRHALTNPLDRVIYTRLGPRKPDFEMVVDLMLESGVLERRIPFEDYVDTRFADGAEHATAWDWEPGSAAAR